MLEKDSFVDLEKIRLEILMEKTQLGLLEFEKDCGKQWVALRLEKPLLETLLKLLIEKQNAVE